MFLPPKPHWPKLPNRFRGARAGFSALEEARARLDSAGDSPLLVPVQVPTFLMPCWIAPSLGASFGLASDFLGSS